MKLHMDCQRYRRQYSATFDGVRVWFTRGDFKMLAILALARLSDDGWMDKYDLDAGGNTPRYLYRAKKAVRDAGIDWDPFENNLDGCYRLAECEITVDWNALGVFATDYADLRAMMVEVV